MVIEISRWDAKKMVLDVVMDKKGISEVFTGGALLLVLILLTYMVKPLIGAFGLTVALSYALHPALHLILPHVKGRSLAITILFFFVLVPLFIFTIVLSSTIVVQLIELSRIPEVQRLIEETGGTVMEYLVAPPVEIINMATITQGFGAVIELLRTVGGFFLQLSLAIFFTVYVLYKEEGITSFIGSIKSVRAREFIEFIDEGLKQVVYSMFLTAIITGGIATVIYAVFRVPFAILLGATTGVVALVPVLGVWLVYLPVTVYFLSQGRPYLAAGFFAICLVLISAVPDIFIRPLIVGRSERINLGLLVLGFVTGTMAFGPVGVIIGPLVIISAIGFINIFLLEEDADLD